MHVEERQKRPRKFRDRRPTADMSPKVKGRGDGPAVALILAGLIVLAFVLRFWRLGEWNFQATEMFTLRDSVTPQFGNSRPLGYLLNYYLVKPFLPLDEFGLRLLPAVFGVLTIPAFYFVSRRLVGTRAALFGTLLLTLSPLLIMYSQLARYWSLVFLLSAIYPYAIYLGIRERDPRALALGVVTGVLAAFAHPVSVLLVGGLALWFVVTYLQPGDLAQLWSRKSVRWGAVLTLIVAALIAARFVPVLKGWITVHDKNPGYGQFLASPPGGPGVKQISYILALVESLTVPLVLSAVAGICVLWQRRDRSLALYLSSLAIFPIAFIMLVSLRTAVSAYYLLPAVPVFFIGAGVFLDMLVEIKWDLRPRWLVPATLTVVIVAAGMPTLISDYWDGRRYDFRSAAHWLEARVTPGDIVFSDQPMVLAHYLPETPVERLRPDPFPLTSSLRRLFRSGAGGALWIVAPAASHAFRTNLREGGLISWIYDNCKLQNSFGVGRVDFREHYVHLYRCQPAAPNVAPRSARSPTTP